MRGALTAATAVALAGCGIFGGAGTGTLTSTGCTNMASGGACQEQTEKIAARHPGARQIDLTCTVAVCDRKAGSGTAVVTMPDGTTVNDVFTYVGAQGAIPVPTCKGLAFDVCKSVADSQIESAAPSRRVVSVEVSCTTQPCTASNGEAIVTVTFADGTTETGSSGWSGGLP